MAHPRWIMAANVDSTAMLSAAMEFYGKFPQLWENMGMDNHLTIIQHYPYLASNIEILPSTPIRCPGAKTWCKRCLEERGGYTFRWLSPWWADTYSRLAQPECWRPGDKEGVSAEMCGLLFTGNLIHYDGELAFSEPSRKGSADACIDTVESSTSFNEPQANIHSVSKASEPTNHGTISKDGDIQSDEVVYVRAHIVSMFFLALDGFVQTVLHLTVLSRQMFFFLLESQSPPIELTQ